LDSGFRDLNGSINPKSLNLSPQFWSPPKFSPDFPLLLLAANPTWWSRGASCAAGLELGTALAPDAVLCDDRRFVEAQLRGRELHANWRAGTGGGPSPACRARSAEFIRDSQAVDEATIRMVKSLFAASWLSDLNRKAPLRGRTLRLLEVSATAKGKPDKSI
jgi:hypothetical protein